MADFLATLLHIVRGADQAGTVVEALKLIIGVCGMLDKGGSQHPGIVTAA